jgi:hypothetical protein
MSTLSLRIPDSLHRVLKRAAEQDGVSINQFVGIAVAEKLSAMQTLNWIAEKAAMGSHESFLKAMSMVPAGEAVGGDEIPSGYKRESRADGSGTRSSEDPATPDDSVERTKKLS